MMIIIVQEGNRVAQTVSARDAMIDAAAALIRQRGVSASGMQDIVAEAAAPRGSIYHHFPGGKDELIVAALDRVTTQVARAIDSIAAKSMSADAFVVGAAAVFRAGAEATDWTQGCPVAAAAIEGDRQSPMVRDAVAASLRRWQTAIADGLRRHLDPDEADAQALMILGAFEGGLLVARGLRSAEPYDAAVRLLRQGLGNAPEKALPK